MVEATCMKASRRGDKNLIRAINRNLVLTLIHEKGPAQWARECHVSDITAAPVTSALVEHVGEGESTDGRRPLLIMSWASSLWS